MAARQDLTDNEDILQDLLLARRATSNFLGLIRSMRETDFAGTTSELGMTRAELVASLSYEARHCAAALEQLRKHGSAQVEAVDSAQILFGSTLPPQALRNLFQHSAVHLDVEWRDLPAASWCTGIRQGTTPVQLLRERAEKLWRAAVALRLGQTHAHIPVELRLSTAP